ncbi:hypothetical protein COP1_015460 [Malus domestica]
MLVSRCAVQFSFGTFFKHLPVSNPATLCPYRFRPKNLTANPIRSSSYFETLDSCQKEQVHLYVHTLLQWNRKMNLTAVKEADEVMERHIEDSLAIIPPIRNSYLSHCNPSSKNLRLVDVGSGAGLPGLILAIAWPGWEVTLMESMNKRCIFLEHVVGHIGLSNVQVVRGRAEVWFPEYCLPLVCVGGLFVAAKGHDVIEKSYHTNHSFLKSYPKCH